MNNISVYIRSKVPNGFNRLDDESIPLTSTNKNHNYQRNHEYQEDFSSHDGCNNNDTFSMNDTSNDNRINEWQAAWNITNAIQVTF